MEAFFQQIICKNYLDRIMFLSIIWEKNHMHNKWIFDRWRKHRGVNPTKMRGRIFPRNKFLESTRSNLN